jgi:hypothetical protein
MAQPTKAEGGTRASCMRSRRSGVDRARGDVEGEGVKFAARHTFLIDPAGRVAKACAGVGPAKHSEEVLAELDGLLRNGARQKLAGKPLNF